MLVNNALLARVFLGEKLGLRDAGSLTLVIAGTSIALAFAPHSDASLTAEELFDLYGDTGFILYAAFCVLFAAAMYALAGRAKKGGTPREKRTPPSTSTRGCFLSRTLASRAFTAACACFC